MKKVVVGSTKEIASMNIIKALGNIADIKLVDSSIIELPEIKDEKRLVIVASPHSSKAGVRSFSIHTTGNFGVAELGGKNKTLGIAPALYLGEGLRKFQELKDNLGLTQEVTLEVTHHGPTYEVPIIYVEIGSDLAGWSDKKSAEVAARVIEHLLDYEPSGSSEIGIGGPHYAPNFTKWVINGRNFGHLCPKYATYNLNEDLLIQMIDKTTPKPEKLVLDWKGIPSSERKRIEKLAKKLGITIQKVR